MAEKPCPGCKTYMKGKNCRACASEAFSVRNAAIALKDKAVFERNEHHQFIQKARDILSDSINDNRKIEKLTSLFKDAPWASLL